MHGSSEGSDMGTQKACVEDEPISQRQGMSYSLCPQRLLNGVEQAR